MTTPVLCIFVDTPAPEPSVLGAACDRVIDSGFGALHEMQIRSAPDPAWEAIDRARIRTALEERDGHVVLRETASGPALEGRLMNSRRSSAGLYVPESRLGPGGAARAQRVLADLLAAFPASASGSVFVDVVADEQDAAPAYARLGVTPLPAPFEGLPWLVALSPVHFEGAYDRADMLATPGVLAEQRDGRVWLQLYDHPFGYTTQASQQRLSRISEHLHQRRRRAPPS